MPHVDKLVIDKDRKITPSRATKNKGKFKIVYSDHFALLLTLKNLTREKDKKHEKKKHGIWQRRADGVNIKPYLMSLVTSSTT